LGQADTSLLEVLNGSLANTAWRKEVYLEFIFSDCSSVVLELVSIFFESGRSTPLGSLNGSFTSAACWEKKFISVVVWIFFLVLYLDVFLKLSWCFLDRLVVTPASKEVHFDSGGVYFFVVHGFCVSW
jgi:hypothetical protein